MSSRTAPRPPPRRADPVDRARALPAPRRPAPPTARRARSTWQIEQVVAHVGDLGVLDPRVADDLLVGRELALHALLDDADGELGRAVRRRARRSRRQQPDGQPGALRPDDAGAVADVEALGLGAVGVHDDLAGREHAVDVEQQEPDAGGFGLRPTCQNICSRHRSWRWTTPSTAPRGVGDDRPT